MTILGHAGNILCNQNSNPHSEQLIASAEFEAVQIGQSLPVASAAGSSATSSATSPVDSSSADSSSATSSVSSDSAAEMKGQNLIS